MRQVWGMLRKGILCGIVLLSGWVTLSWAADEPDTSAAPPAGASGLRQDRKAYHEEISGLKAERRDSVQAGDKEKAKELTQQIHQTRQEGRQELRQDRRERREDRRDRRQDRREFRKEHRPGNPPGPAGGPGVGPHRPNPPGPIGGPGRGGVRPGGGGGRRR